jgi:hypothetical protein
MLLAPWPHHGDHAQAHREAAGGKEVLDEAERDEKELGQEIRGEEIRREEVGREEIRHETSDDEEERRACRVQPQA